MDMIYVLTVDVECVFLYVYVLFVVLFVCTTLFKQTRILLDVWTGLHREEHSPHLMNKFLYYFVYYFVYGLYSLSDLPI